MLVDGQRGLEYLTICFASSVEIEMGEDPSDSDGEFRNIINMFYVGLNPPKSGFISFYSR